MDYYDPSIRGAVTVFRDDDCEGHSDRFYWDDQDPYLEGSYTFQDITKNNYDHINEANSVVVPFGYRLLAYHSDGFRDLTDVFEGGYLNDITQKSFC